MTNSVTVQNIINAPLEKVWEYYTNPQHVVHWNNASEDWHTPKAENDLRVGGKFSYRMESVDGKNGFDFEGVYDELEVNTLIKYSMADGRKVTVLFTPQGESANIEVTFDLENENSEELQRQGWQAILDNFKKYVESN